MTHAASILKIEASGLEDVVAATTRLSDVDGENGRLTLAGKPVEDLAGKLSFEQAIWLLWHGAAATEADAARVRERLGEAREAAFDRIGELGDALALPEAMDALRTAMSHLPSAHGDAFDEALQVTAATAVFAAAWARSPSPVRPDPRLGHAADYL